MVLRLRETHSVRGDNMSKIRSVVAVSSIERMKYLFSITFSIDIITNDIEEVRNHLIAWYQVLDQMDKDEFLYRLQFVRFIIDPNYDGYYCGTWC